MRIMTSTILAFAITMLTSMFSLASDCSEREVFDNGIVRFEFELQIKRAHSCSEAVKIAVTCQKGNSADVQPAQIAAEVCSQELERVRPPAKLKKLLSSMINECNQKYSNRLETMAISQRAHCALSAIKWMVGLATPN